MNNYTTTPGDWGTPLDTKAITKAIEDMKASLPPPPPSPFASVFSAKWPVDVDWRIPEDGLLMFTRPLGGLALLTHPKYFAMTHPKYFAMIDSVVGGGGGEELRVGPFTAPSGRQWAIVKDRDSGRRYVVDWPRADVMPRTAS